MGKREKRDRREAPDNEKYLDCQVILTDGRKVFLEDYNPHTGLYSGTDETKKKIYIKPHEIER